MVYLSTTPAPLRKAFVPNPTCHDSADGAIEEGLTHEGAGDVDLDKHPNKLHLVFDIGGMIHTDQVTHIILPKDLIDSFEIEKEVREPRNSYPHICRRGDRMSCVEFLPTHLSRHLF